ncbi:hypothetical protein DASC09_020110 [Saccharomycopsis crataegensis]|uniref:Peptidase A1 domain-containing protein n=1 Tax=Saccharomycopsis crataegensis TaxID=43959 RepID=A0AAV5QJ31_9ASCO|nr:hypothetical protein DASC09_020110 [Saccharomycopsis crataegensis]
MLSLPNQRKPITLPRSAYNKIIDMEFRRNPAPPIVCNLRYANGFYTMTLCIGGNEEEIDFIIDTGSSILMVPCDYIDDWDPDWRVPSGRKYVFDNLRSDSFATDNKPIIRSIAGPGRVEGIIAQDDVLVINSWTSEVAASRLNFMLSSDDTLPAGILGLSYPQLIDRQQIPYSNVIEYLYKGGNIPSFSYSLYLRRQGSTIVLGGYDPAQFQGSFKYLSIIQQTNNQKQLLQSKMKSVYLGKTSLGISGTASFNTGVPLISLPYKTVEKLYGLLGIRSKPNLQKRTQINSNLNFGKDHFLTFEFPTTKGQSVRIRVPLSSLISHVDDDIYVLDILSNTSGQIILGSQFFESTVTYFDYTNNSIGMVESNEILNYLGPQPAQRRFI